MENINYEDIEFHAQDFLKNFKSVKDYLPKLTAKYIEDNEFFHDFYIKSIHYSIVMANNSRRKPFIDIEIILYDYDEMLDDKYRIVLKKVKKSSLSTCETILNGMINLGIDSIYYAKITRQNDRYCVYFKFISNSYIYVEAEKLIVKNLGK